VSAQGKTLKRTGVVSLLAYALERRALA
jgi:hypothetical protein